MAKLVLFCTLQAAAFGDFAAPRTSVDLDVEPEHRWDHVVEEHKEKFVTAVDTIFNDPKIKPVVPLARALIGNEIEARRLLPGEQYAEARGISRVLGIPIADLVIVGAFYDVFAAAKSPLAEKACTGVVAESPDGKIIHGRNLDYDFADALANLTLVVDFKRKGSIIFTAVTFGPCPNFNTVVKYGAFSISQDERDRGSILTNLYDMLINGRPAVFSRIRQAVETLSSFEEAVDFFSETKLNAAAYFIIGGTKSGEGAVVTCDRDEVADVWRLDADGGRWYILETNYDHYLPPGHNDDRRHPLQRFLNATGRDKISPNTMWDTISLSKANKSAGERAPLNGETIYSTVMQASNKDSFKTVVRARRIPTEIPVVV